MLVVSLINHFIIKARDKKTNDRLKETYCLLCSRSTSKKSGATVQKDATLSCITQCTVHIQLHPTMKMTFCPNYIHMYMCIPEIDMSPSNQNFIFDLAYAPKCLSTGISRVNFWTSGTDLVTRY